MLENITLSSIFTLQNYTLDFIQWPAMITTLASAWLVAAQSKARRRLGFWLFILSNILWVIWGVYAKAYALIFLQVGLLFLNLRGAYKNKTDTEDIDVVSSRLDSKSSS